MAIGRSSPTTDPLHDVNRQRCILNIGQDSILVKDGCLGQVPLEPSVPEGGQQTLLAGRKKSRNLNLHPCCECVLDYLVSFSLIADLCCRSAWEFDHSDQG